MNAIDRATCTALILVGVQLLLTGCSIGKKSVLFVTSTAFALHVDSKPPVFNLGYSRQEGTLAPVVEDGQVLPQMASFRFNAGLGGGGGDQQARARGARAGVGQSFATGTAAVLISKYLNTPARPKNAAGPIEDTEISAVTTITEPLGGESTRRRYFFGTDTTLGIKVTLSAETGGYPDSFTFGWKRKEVAYIPLQEKAMVKTRQDAKPEGSKQEIALPSLIATVGVSSEGSATGVDAVLSQFYATGLAASYLAAQPGIREAIGSRVLDDEEYAKKLAQYRETTGQQESQAVRILRCYAGVKFMNFPDVWKDANDHELLKDPGDLTFMTQAHTAAAAENDAAKHDELMRRAQQRYATAIALVEGAEPTRLAKLTAHRQKVCEIAQR